MHETALCPNGFRVLQAPAPTRMLSTHNLRQDLNLPGSNSGPHPADFPLGSAESRAAARALLSCQPITVVDFGTLPMPLPTYEEILRDWKDEGDCYTHEQRRDSTLLRRAILKDSDAFRRIRASSPK